jgi:hypothetical protein
MDNREKGKDKTNYYNSSNFLYFLSKKREKITGSENKKNSNNISEF